MKGGLIPIGAGLALLFDTVVRVMKNRPMPPLFKLTGEQKWLLRVMDFTVGGLLLVWFLLASAIHLSDNLPQHTNIAMGVGAVLAAIIYYVIRQPEDKDLRTPLWSTSEEEKMDRDDRPRFMVELDRLRGERHNKQKTDTEAFYLTGVTLELQTELRSKYRQHLAKLSESHDESQAVIDADSKPADQHSLDSLYYRLAMSYRLAYYSVANADWELAEKALNEMQQSEPTTVISRLMITLEERKELPKVTDRS